jgi:hypothetical protein
MLSAGYSGVSPEDRAYLVRLAASVTGASDAEKRVDTVIAQARDNIRKARRSGVILSFRREGVGAAVAWFAAFAGGHHRDGNASCCSSVERRWPVPLPRRFQAPLSFHWAGARSSSSNPNSESRASKVGRSDGDSGPLRGDASNQGSPDTSLAMSAACFRL